MRIGIGAGLLFGGLWAAARGPAVLRREALVGKVVLITGGSRGLGLARARAFGRQGCRVAVCARNIPTLAKARDALAAEGVAALTFPCDVTDRLAVARRGALSRRPGAARAR